MSYCCQPEGSPERKPSASPEVKTSACPQCGYKGLKVKPITLQSMIAPAELGSVELTDFYFCRTEDCPIAYFGPHGQCYDKSLVHRPIYQKDLAPEVLVCYCFKVSRQDVVESVKKGLGLQVYDQVKQQKEEEGCDCERKNPQGNCCFGNIKKLSVSVDLECQS